MPASWSFVFVILLFSYKIPRIKLYFSAGFELGSSKFHKVSDSGDMLIGRQMPMNSCLPLPMGKQAYLGTSVGVSNFASVAGKDEKKYERNSVVQNDRTENDNFIFYFGMLLATLSCLTHRQEILLLFIYFLKMDFQIASILLTRID